MEGEVGKKALECILMPAMLAAKNVRAQRDRLLQLRRRLQRSPGSVQEVAADLFKVYSTGLKAGGGYLSGCLEIAYENDADLSFSNPAFAFIPDEQLYDALFAQAQRLPARPTTQTEAFARIELGYYAIKLPAGHHIPRCIEFLIGVRPPTDTGKPDDCMVGYSDDTIAAATDHIFKTRLSDMSPPDASDATERIPKTRPCRSKPPTRPKLPPPSLGRPLRWPAARTRTRRSATSTARAPWRASRSSTSTSPLPSSPASWTPRRSLKPLKWPTNTHTSLRKDPIHQMINQAGFVKPQKGAGILLHF
uniref:Uncharacterized protein n=1 Tax=Avena sativa TaxID=4498 RepID=A0ACD6AKI3_AVESA